MAADPVALTRAHLGHLRNLLAAVGAPSPQDILTRRGVHGDAGGVTAELQGALDWLKEAKDGLEAKARDAIARAIGDTAAAAQSANLPNASGTIPAAGTDVAGDPSIFGDIASAATWLQTSWRLLVLGVALYLAHEFG